MSEEITDLSEAEYAALKRAAAPSRSGILMFLANSALDRIRLPAPLPHQARQAALQQRAVTKPAGSALVVIRDGAGIDCAWINLDPKTFAFFKKNAAARGWTLRKYFEESIELYAGVKILPWRSGTHSRPAGLMAATAKQSRQGGRQ